MSLQTKDRILDVAEELFSDFGFATTSLRDITSTAGVNLASVNYHFGSKGSASCRRPGQDASRRINERRLERLDAVEREAVLGPPDVESDPAMPFWRRRSR